MVADCGCLLLGIVIVDMMTSNTGIRTMTSYHPTKFKLVPRIQKEVKLMPAAHSTYDISLKIFVLAIM